MTEKNPRSKNPKKIEPSLRLEIKDIIKDEFTNILAKQFEEFFHRLVVKEGKKLSRISYDHMKNTFRIAADTHVVSARRANTAMTKLSKSAAKITANFDNIMKRISDMEETFFFIYTTIKRNQFMYTYYPEDYDKKIVAWREQRRAEEEELNNKENHV